jgi:hypothetical protein
MIRRRGRPVRLAGVPGSGPWWRLVHQVVSAGGLRPGFDSLWLDVLPCVARRNWARGRT